VAGKTQNGVWPLAHLPWLIATVPEIEPNGHAGLRRIDDQQTGLDVSAEEHFTRRFCQHVIDQHDFLELFGCDIPRELQRQQLSVAYVSLNLSTESEEEASDAVQARLKLPVNRVGDESDNQEGHEDDLGDASAGLEYVLDDVAGKTGRLMVRGPAGAGKSTLLR
jgi:ABC-type uncharacterized transport system fused permease/ATPase subunit